MESETGVLKKESIKWFKLPWLHFAFGTRIELWTLGRMEWSANGPFECKVISLPPCDLCPHLSRFDFRGLELKKGRLTEPRQFWESWSRLMCGVLVFDMEAEVWDVWLVLMRTRMRRNGSFGLRGISRIRSDMMEELREVDLWGWSGLVWDRWEIFEGSGIWVVTFAAGHSQTCSLGQVSGESWSRARHLEKYTDF